MTRHGFVSRHGSCAYVAVTHDEKGANLPHSIDGNPVAWTRIEASQGELFPLISTPDMERDLQEHGVHITETRTKRPGRAGPFDVGPFDEDAPEWCR